jgi:Xaa-Pro aminopeptidase
MFKDNRDRFFELMGDGIAIVPAASTVLRNADTEFDFRQNSTFWYLTGFNEPDAIAVFSSIGKKKQFVLFVRPRDKTMEVWAGKREGPKGAKRNFGATAAYNIEEFEERLADLMLGHSRLFINTGTASSIERFTLETAASLRQKRRIPGKIPYEVHELSHLIADLRLIKSTQELENLRAAAEVSAKAFKEVFSVLKPGIYEYQARAIFEFVYGINDADWAFQTIVAAGANACTLHYVDCNSKIEDGQLVLFDAGAEKNYYSSDVSRTVPANGKFSKNQRDIYEIVLAAQRASIETVKPGNTLVDVNNAAGTAVIEGLLKLGILKGKLSTLVRNEAWKTWLPHGVSHWMGLDVHDVGDYALDEGYQKLEPGMVLTVEPGLYFQLNDKKVPEKYRGIGIRIEDDVLVTEEGADVLTNAIPREIEDIEKAMAANPKFIKKFTVKK